MPRNAAASSHVRPGVRIHAIDVVQLHIGTSPIPAVDSRQTIVIAALPANSSAETPKKAHREPRSENMRRDLSSCGCADDLRLAQRASYSSWRRHQTPVSLRPLGARSSHWYMPHSPSSPRA